MRYKDKRGWLFEVRPGTYGWTIYCYNPKKQLWWPWPCTCWYGSKKEAERALVRYAKERGWGEVESDLPASPAGKGETEMEKGKLNALKYLQKRLDEKQIDVLAYCLTHEVPVAFYGSGLGKSTLANRLRAAGYQGVYAPEDCSMACNHLTVPDIGGAVALCVEKKSSGSDVPEDFFTSADLRAVIEAVSKRTR